MKPIFTLLVHTFISLFAMVNPIGNAPIFLGLTRGYSRQERTNIAYRVAIYGAILLITALFIGQAVMLFFGISLQLIQVAGGMLVFFTAWEMLNYKFKINQQETKEAAHETDIAFFPLTMPITAGAGSLAIIIATAARLNHNFSITMFTQYAMVIVAILVVFAFVAVCYRFADPIFTRLGQTGTNVLTRLFAFILLAIGVGLVWDGVKGLVSAMH